MIDAQEMRTNTVDSFKNIIRHIEEQCLERAKLGCYRTTVQLSMLEPRESQIIEHLRRSGYNVTEDYNWGSKELTIDWSPEFPKSKQHEN